MSLSLQTGTTFSLPPKPIYNWIPPTTATEFGGFFIDGDSQRLMFGVKDAIPFDCIYNCGAETWGFPVLRWQVRAGQTAHCYDISVTSGNQLVCSLASISSNGIRAMVGARVKLASDGTSPWTWTGWNDLTPSSGAYTKQLSTTDSIEQVEVRVAF